MLVEIELPLLPAAHRHRFLEMARRRGDFALVGVAAVVTLDADGTLQQMRGSRFAASAIGRCWRAMRRAR